MAKHSSNNANNANDEVLEVQLSNTDVVKCPNCGANMEFDIGTGQLACAHCDSQEAIMARRAGADRDYFRSLREGAVDTTGVVYRCPNCSAETTLTDYETSVNCPFCGSTNTVKTDEIPGMKPDAILPFRWTKEQAYESGKKWIKRKVFAPGKLRKNFDPEKVNGVYVPNFKFNADTYSSYYGTLGKYYYVTVGTGENRHQERRVRYFNINGSLNKFYADILVEASSKIEQKHIDKLVPFDVENSVGYTDEFVAGFSAERYNDSLESCFGVAKGKIDSYIKAAILAKYDYDVVQSLNISTTLKSVTFKYMLLPLWICAFKFKEKLYNYFINGRTGKATGKAPVSAGKVITLVLSILAVIAVAVVCYIKFGG